MASAQPMRVRAASYTAPWSPLSPSAPSSASMSLGRTTYPVGLLIILPLSCGWLVRQHLRGGRTPAAVPACPSSLHFRVCGTLGLTCAPCLLPRGEDARVAGVAVGLLPLCLRLPALGLPLLATREAQGPHRRAGGAARPRARGVVGHVTPPWRRGQP